MTTKNYLHTLTGMMFRMVIASLSILLLMSEPSTGQERSDRGEIVGLKGAGLSPAAVEILRRHGFVVAEEVFPRLQLFYDHFSLLPDSEMRKLSKAEELSRNTADLDESIMILRAARAQAGKFTLRAFVTADTMLHAYHAIYVDSLISLETSQAALMKKWYANVWADVPSIAKGTGLVDAKEVLRLVGLVAVGRKLMEPDWKPKGMELPGWVDQEVKRILAAEGRFPSNCWDREIEYSTFKPRGFYADGGPLARYFRARMWLSRYPFRSDKELEVRLAAKFVSLLSLSDKTYNRLVTPARMLLGRAEDPTLLDLSQAIMQADPLLVWGEEERRSHLPEIVKKMESRFAPRIRVGDAPKELSKPGELYGIYVLAPSYILDSAVFTMTTAPPFLDERLPGGLDMMSVLGRANNLAERLLLKQTDGPLVMPLRRVIGEARAMVKQDRHSSQIMAFTYRMLDALLRPRVGPEHPSFMRNEAYKRKSLQTALAGWAEHRNRWILHAKQSSSLFGDFRLDIPPGFVEPNVEFWQRMLDLAVITRKYLSPLKAAENDRWNDFMSTLVRCKIIAEAQLAGRAFSKDDEEFFASFDKKLESLYGEREAQSRSQAVVADVHREVLTRKVVHVGTGLPQAIYVVYPWQGKQWLCKGGVMTYREYVAEGGRTLTVKTWAKMAPKLPQPQWTKDFALPPDAD